jgi:anti-sigma regulatory factor (Ser/Thr protein kinase)
MDKILNEAVERAQKEVKKLLAEAQAGKLDRNKLETGLKEVQSALKVMGIHAHKHDPE